MNSKRGRKPKIIKLGTYNLTKRDIINIEKIITKRITPTDFYVSIGKPKGIFQTREMTFNTAKSLPKSRRAVRHLEIRAKAPNISVKFSPYSTQIKAQRIYSRGRKLKAIEEIVSELKNYFNQLKAQGLRTDVKFSRLLLGNRIKTKK